ncbi:MAG: hypothetical protein HY820_25070 [Acidobacteria bacterium]|nr:hypothetical protein [Acidobacteriota bacterium]
MIFRSHDYRAAARNSGPCGGAANGNIFAGAIVQISYTFESTAADQVPGDPSTGSYLSVGPPFAMTFTFPNQVFTGADSIHVGIFNSLVDQSGRA